MSIIKHLANGTLLDRAQLIEQNRSLKFLNQESFLSNPMLYTGLIQCLPHFEMRINNFLVAIEIVMKNIPSIFLVLDNYFL